MQGNLEAVRVDGKIVCRNCWNKDREETEEVFTLEELLQAEKGEGIRCERCEAQIL